MDCPQCKAPMRHGYLCAGGFRLIWTPREYKFSSFPGKEDVLLQRMTMGGKNKVEGYLCTVCRTVIAQYHED